MTITKLIFFFSLFIIFYTYIGHALVLNLIGRIRPNKWEKGDIDLDTIVYVSAYNEEKSIDKKIRNLLDQDYKGRYRIVIANDGSKDRTADIVRSFNDPRIILYDFKENRGKAMMQNAVIPELDSHLVIFSDATSIWTADTVRKIVENFKDPDVGCVSVDIIFVKQTEAGVEKGQGAYWKLERFLRTASALVKTNIVASGTCYAIRRELFAPLPTDVGEDLATPLNVVFNRGKRVIFTPEIAVEERSSTTHESEFKMRIRIAIRNVTALFRYWRFLHPQYGFAAYQLLVHKYLRILSWIFLFSAFITHLILARQSPYNYFLPLHMVFYGIAFLGYLSEKKGKRAKLMYIPYYFILLNLACFLGFISYVRGERKPTWVPER
jgi:cellulose synthase/poly-beta-1,6-N-acetylglucosamine synthase-like glycosyltransferase